MSNISTEVIAKRTRRDRNESCEMVETLTKNPNGEFELRRQFMGDYTELNIVRGNFVIDHEYEKISADAAQLWLEKSKTEQIPNSLKDKPASGVNMYCAKNEETDYDGSWFRDFLENNIADTSYVEISVGFYYYDEENHFWNQMSDPFPLDAVEVGGMSLSKLYDTVTATLKSIHGGYIFRENETPAFFDRITLYAEDREIGSVENNDLARMYAEIAERTDTGDYDILGWNWY